MSNMFYQNHFNVCVLKLFPLPIDVTSKSQNFQENLYKYRYLQLVLISYDFSIDDPGDI